MNWITENPRTLVVLLVAAFLVVYGGIYGNDRMFDIGCGALFAAPIAGGTIPARKGKED